MSTFAASGAACCLLEVICKLAICFPITKMLLCILIWGKDLSQGQIQGGPWGPRPPLTTKNEAPAPKFYKIEAPEWQF